MKYTMPILALMAFVTVCKADDATLADFLKIYESRAGQIEATYSNAVAAALQEYGVAAAQAKERYRKQGDLDGLLGVTKELERFAKERNCPDADPKGLPSLVANARATYRGACATASTKKTSDLIALAEAYSSRLDALEKDYVKHEAIKAAVQVREEAKRIEFILADMGSQIDRDSNRAPALAAASEPRGLVLYYPFDRDGGAIVNDKSDQGNNGEAHGVRWTHDGKNGGGLAFDGEGDFVQAGSNDFLDVPAGSALTISLWVRCATFGRYDTVIGKTGLRGNDEWAITVRPGSRMAFDAYGPRDGAKFRTTIEGPPMKAKRWYHVAGIIDDGKASFFVDGQEQDRYETRKDDTFSGDSSYRQPIVNSLRFRIGCSCHKHQDEHPDLYHFHGVIDEVMAFDRALSRLEIGRLYQAQK